MREHIRARVLISDEEQPGIHTKNMSLPSLYIASREVDKVESNCMSDDAIDSQADM